MTEDHAKGFNPQEEACSNDVDAFVAWPGNEELRPILRYLQRLNPTLGLDCALTHWPAEDREVLMVKDGVETREMQHTNAGESEYLVWNGSPLVPVTITMPTPATDSLLSSLTDRHRDFGSLETDHGRLRYGRWRFERTAEGRLLIRPMCWPVVLATGIFGHAYQKDQSWFKDHLGRIKYRWGIARPHDEVWEVEYAYLGPEFRYVPGAAHWPEWTTVPVGTISYIDHHDLPMEEHHARARAIVEMGAQFAAVGNLDQGEMLVFRQSSIERFVHDFRLPEMAWFDVPVRIKTKGLDGGIFANGQ